ncbi:MAG: hypothetical protein ACOC1F_02310 [Myxococcota bacterium]
MTKRSLLATLTATGLSACLVCCSSYEGFELRSRSTPPVPVAVDAGSVMLPQGVAVAVQVIAPGAEDPQTGELYVGMRSSDPSVMAVWPTVEQGTFVVYGVSEGTAVLTVMFEDEDDETIPAKVTGIPSYNGDP